MGIDTSPAAGWVRHKGLRVFGGGQVVEVDWPELERLARLRPGPHPPRARRACWPRTRRPPARGCAPASRSPARCSTTPAASSACTPRSAPTRSRPPGARRWSSRPTGSPAGSRKSLGLVRREDRPLGVAVRRYVRTPRSVRRLPGHLLRPRGRRPAAATRCPATAGSSAWATARRTSASACSTPAASTGDRPPRGPAPTGWRHCPAEWGLDRGATPSRPLRGAGLPMALQPQPAYTRGLLLAGDCGRRGQPVQRRGHQLRDGDRPHGRRDGDRGARAGPTGRAREAGAAPLPDRLRAEYGRHYRLGMGFLALLGHPRRRAVRHRARAQAAGRWSAPRCGSWAT